MSDFYLDMYTDLYGSQNIAATAGVIGATVKHSSTENATQSITDFNNTVWPNGKYAAQGMKVYFDFTGPAKESDGTGNIKAFPTTSDGITTGKNSNFTTLVFNYRPFINQNLTAWDSQTGSAGTGQTTATHGGTQADWNALVNSVSALKTLCDNASIKMYVVLWQEIEHMAAPTTGGGINLTAAQYWSMLSWYGNAITAGGLTSDRLLHSSSATYSGRLDDFFPANQTANGGPSAALVGGGTTDFYSRSWQDNGYRLDSVPSNAKYSTCIIDHCANAGIPFMGVLEMGVGGNNVPSIVGIYEYLTHINQVAVKYPNAMYMWYGEYIDSEYGLIPGYASGGTATVWPPPSSPNAQNPGPYCNDPTLDPTGQGAGYLGIKQLAATLAGGDTGVVSLSGSGALAARPSVTIHQSPIQLTGATRIAVTADQNAHVSLSGTTAIAPLHVSQETSIHLAGIGSTSTSASPSQQGVANLSSDSQILAASASFAGGAANINAVSSVISKPAVESVSAMSASGAVTANAQQNATVAAQGASTIQLTASQGSSAPVAGAGSVTAYSTVYATASLNGAGAVTGNYTASVKINVSGGGGIAQDASQGAFASLAGAGTTAQSLMFLGFASFTGAGIVTPHNTSSVLSHIAGAGATSAFYSASPVADLNGEGMLITASVVQGQSVTISGQSRIILSLVVPSSSEISGTSSIFGKVNTGSTNKPKGRGTVAALGCIRGRAHKIQAFSRVHAKATVKRKR